jgi:hypothetical protein
MHPLSRCVLAALFPHCDRLRITSLRNSRIVCASLRFITLHKVPGAFPWVELSMRQPVGAVTGRLLPTGSLRDVFDGVEVRRFPFCLSIL